MVRQAVFFDFDGVIIETENIKTAAFEGLFESCGPRMVEKITAYQLSHGGVSRFEKFKHIHEKILKIPLSEKELARLGEEFSERVLSSVLKAPLITGAEDTLKTLLENRIPAFVVSGTPHEELSHIVQKRNLARYFRETHGSPLKKPEIVLNLSRKYDLDRSRCLFVGDAMADYSAATSTGTNFFGIVPPGRTSPFPEGTPVSSDVTAILKHQP